DSAFDAGAPVRRGDRISAMGSAAARLKRGLSPGSDRAGRLLLSLALLVLPLFIATVKPQEQTAAGRRTINQSADPLLAPFRFRSIGPASMGGRVDDIAVSESNPNIFYIGYAVGGVFKSENNGTTFEPVFETYGTASIGAIAIH